MIISGVPDTFLPMLTAIAAAVVLWKVTNTIIRGFMLGLIIMAGTLLLVIFFMGVPAL